jgi:hypothetical protein
MDSNTVMAIATIVLAISTVVLVVVTSYYARQTQKSVKVMEKANALQFRPSLIATIDFKDNIRPELQITNLGKGPAKDIQINIQSIENPDETKFTFSSSLIAVNENKNFMILLGKNKYGLHMQDFKETQFTLKIEYNYKDLLDNTYLESQEIDLTSHIKQFDHTLLMNDDNYLARISENVMMMASAMMTIAYERK